MDARLFHVNINCSDLERSKRFYVDGLGLTVGAHTATEAAQPGTAFGLDKARWDAWILLGARGFEGGAVDLLEWQEPVPTGEVPGALTQAGWQRCGFRVPDLDAAMTRVRELGGAIWDAPVTHETNGHQIRIVLGNDPDGVALEIIEAGLPGLSFVGVACTDLERSLAYYSALGFEAVGEFSSEKDDAPNLRISGPVSMHERILRAPSGGDVFFILVGFARPGVTAATARPANALGMWRTAFLVPDLDAAYEELRGLGIDAISPPVEMAMGEGLPDLRFFCFAGPDGEVLELIEEPT